MREDLTKKRSKAKDQQVARRELYKTTFHEAITYEVQDFISYSFIKNVMQEIAQRAGVNEEKIKLKLSAKNYSIDMHSTEVRASLIEAKKYNREIDGLSVESGIVPRGKKENFVDQDHHSIRFDLVRSTTYTHSSLQVYGVSHERATSQEILDWGNGAIRDFQTLQILDQKPKAGEPVICLKTGLVELWEKDTAIQKVEIINDVPTKGTTWKNFFKDPNPTVALIGIIIAAVLVIAGWIWFSK